jgi:hypothetical protein
MSDPIYVIEEQNDVYEDKTKEVIFADTNEAIAYKRADEIKANFGNETVFFSIWLNGMLTSQHMRTHACVNGKDLYSKWERNCGEINHKLEGK